MPDGFDIFGFLFIPGGGAEEQRREGQEENISKK